MISSSLKQLIEKTLKEWEVPGIAIALVEKDESGQWGVTTEGFGMRDSKQAVDEKTLFAVASNSKLFTALSVSMIIARSEGKIKYTTKIKDLLPEFSMKDKLASERCTLEDLLCHRSGLGRFNDLLAYEKLDDLPGCISALDSAADFRDVYLYNNWAYDLLALIVQRVSGIEYHLFVQRNILDPLGMAYTTFELDKAGGNVATGHWRHGETADGAGKNIELANGLNMGRGLRGAGGMMSNAKDMAIWLRTLLEQGGANLPDDSVKQFFKDSIRGRTIVDVVAETSDLTPKLYGLARRIGSYQGVQFIEHGGAVSVGNDPVPADLQGHMSQVCVIPDHNFGVALMTNSSPWGDLVYNIIKWRLFEEKCGLKRVDWNARYVSKLSTLILRYTARRQRELQAASPEYIFPAVPVDTTPVPISDAELCSTYTSGGLSLTVSKVVPRSDFPQLEALPHFPMMWGRVSVILAHRSGKVYDGCLEYTPLGQEGVKMHGKKMVVEVEVEGDTVRGLGIKGMIGAPVTRTGEAQADIYFAK